MRLLAAGVAWLLLVARAAAGGGGIDWELYHRTDALLEWFQTTARKHPETVRYEEIPDPDSAFRLPQVTVTDFASGEAGKEVILLVAGEHARELITSEIAFWLVALLSGQGEELQEWAATQPVQAAAWRSGQAQGTLEEWGRALVKAVVFKIFPVENISGRKAVEAGEACLRKTVSGVDLNRNWPFAWQQAAEGAEEYGGPAPLSEPEARIVRWAAQISRPQAYVNLHSGEWAMYVPWDSRSELAPSLPGDTGELLEKMNVHCECMKGAAGAVAGYLAMGTSMDWMHVEQHVPYSLTFEVYGPRGLGKLANGGHPRRLQQSDGGQEASCIEAFNPTNREEYESTVASWVGSLLVLAQHLAAHPRASTAAHDAQQQQLPEPQPPPTKQELSRQGEAALQSGHDEAVLRGFPVKDLERRQAREQPPPAPATAGAAAAVRQGGQRQARQAPAAGIAPLLHNVGIVVMVAFAGGGLLAAVSKAAAGRRQAAQARHFRSSKADV